MGPITVSLTPSEVHNPTPTPTPNPNSNSNSNPNPNPNPNPSPNLCQDRKHEIDQQLTIAAKKAQDAAIESGAEQFIMVHGLIGNDEA